MEVLMAERVKWSLGLYMYSNAVFICERLCAQYPSENNFQLMANCFLRNNQAYRAYHMLKGKQLPQSRYLFAHACFQMGNLREAESALSPVNEQNNEIPNGAAGQYLLGLIYRNTDRRKLAIEHFVQALSLDPLLWVAYEELCTLGAEEEAVEAYSDSAIFCLQQQQLQLEPRSSYMSLVPEDWSMPSIRSSFPTDTSPRHSKNLPPGSHGEMHAGYTSTNVASNASAPFATNMSAYSTPSPLPSQVPPAAPPPLNRNVQGQHNTLSTTGESSPRANINPLGHRRKLMDEGKLRKVSGRLFPESGPRRSTRLSGEATGQTSSNVFPVGSNGTTNSSAKLFGALSSTSKISVAGTMRHGHSSKAHSISMESIYEDGKKYEPIEESGHEDIVSNSIRRGSTNTVDDESRNHSKSNSRYSRVVEGSLEFLALLRIIGEAFRHFCMHRCKEAVEVFYKLPHHQYATGWVLSQVGKAHFEMVDYCEAERSFSWARQVSPYHLEGMDIYSTVLYHMREEMKLSFLAQELNAIDRLSPEAWCALGNCYSLQKDHETALKIFQRAIQINPRFTYAYTLCGHEYVAMEEFENGINSFRGALRINPRHYNSWYGLGMIFLRQEKFGFAEQHFQMAYTINPRSSVLLCYLGMALHFLKRDAAALEMLDKAIAADPKNPLPLYQKANVLAGIEMYEEALKELMLLKEVAPRESSVYSLTGRIYKKLNMPERAMYYFSLALDLKPSTPDVTIIKSAIEKLNVPDDIEDHL